MKLHFPNFPIIARIGFLECLTFGLAIDERSLVRCCDWQTG